jgi:hypothetical protein
VLAVFAETKVNAESLCLPKKVCWMQLVQDAFLESKLQRLSSKAGKILKLLKLQYKKQHLLKETRPLFQILSEEKKLPNNNTL